MDLPPDQKRKIGAVAVRACLVAVAAFVIYTLLPSHTVVIPDVTTPLGLQPRTTELTVERAVRARDAIIKGDYAAARTIVTTELAHSKIENWRFHPFRDFISNVSDVHDPHYGEHVDAWVKSDTTGTLSLLVRAQYKYDMAWAARGINYNRQTNSSDLNTFDFYLRQANADIDSVLAKDNANPYNYMLKLRILQGSGFSSDLETAFQNTISKYPFYYSPYSIVLATMQPKWGGSVPTMMNFVDTYAGKAPATSPLKMLYVELYGHLLSLSSEACSNRSLNEDGMNDCVSVEMQKLTTRDLEAEVSGALQLYKTSDKYQYDLELSRHLQSMIRTSGAAPYAGAILQLAAHAADSDTQLIEDKASHPNDYMIDSLVGLSWAVQKDYPAAIKKNEEALRDIGSAVFPNEEAKDLAYAALFEGLAGDYDKLHQHVKEIAYERAAVSYGGPSAYEHLICYAYVQLQHYQEAADACTPFISGPDEIESRFWRAAAYYNMHQSDEAAVDLKVITDSENAQFRMTALINLSVYYADKHDFRAMVDLFNAHPYAFDKSSQKKIDLAAVYNNRCYAYMQLGQLHEALDDCTASLKYGSLPDAYHKQQELITRLRADPKL